jgi:hypothetical protein
MPNQLGTRSQRRVPKYLENIVIYEFVRMALKSHSGRPDSLTKTPSRKGKLTAVSAQSHGSRPAQGRDRRATEGRVT